MIRHGFLRRQRTWWRTGRLGIALPLCAAAVMVAASACGSSGNGNSATSPGPVSPKPTGTPYVIGQVGAFSGAYASSDDPAEYGLDAWAKYTNDHGGINGHPVQLISKDDQGSAALALTEVKELVEQDHVMALIGIADLVEQAWTPYIASGTVPVIGDTLADDTMGTVKNFFPEGTTRATGYYWGVPKVAALQGKTKLGVIYCAESTACSQITDNQKQQAASAGVSVVYTGSASATATSYASQCLAAKNAGAEAVALMLAPQVAGRVASACAQQGYHPQWIQAANGFSQQATSNPALDGVVGPIPDFPWFASDTPQTQVFQQALKTYEPDIFSNKASNGYSEGTAQAWAAAEIFKAAALTLQPGHETGQDVINALYNLPKNDTFGGLTPPISYSAPTSPSGGPQPMVTCFYAIQLKSGKYSELNNGQPTCQS